ncbi:MAG: autotransporter domain-containing protein [Planctomycetia bacterium]|nr:autotransporter domain-containing protein [Planctomycetia bacterium]
MKQIVKPGFVRKSLFIALLFVFLCGTDRLQSQTLPITEATSMTATELSSYSTVDFKGEYVLTITGDGGKITPVFISPTVTTTSAATVQFGSTGTTNDAVWDLTKSSSSWSGVFDVYEGTLQVSSAGKYALGLWNDGSGTGTYATVNVQGGSSLDVLASTAMGNLTISDTVTTTLKETIITPAEILVAADKTLTVQNGIDNGSTLPGGTIQNIIKTGKGSLVGVSNSLNPVFNLGNIDIDNGTFTLKSGSTSINDATLSINSLTVGADGSLDIQRTNQVVEVGSLYLEAGSDVNIYVDSAAGTYTSFNATDEVIIGTVGALAEDEGALFNIISDNAAAAPDSMTLITTDSTLTATPANIIVTDNILGKSYTASLSDDEKSLIVTASNSDQFLPRATTTNTRNVAKYLDNAIAKNQYGGMYNVLSQLENNASQLRQVTGEIHASNIAFQFMNNYLTVQHVNEQLRNIPLITYSGQAARQTGNTMLPGVNTNTGGWDTAPYGPGYAPAYDPQQPYNTVPEQSQPVGFYHSSIFDEPGTGLVRGQCPGDPGTLIYSAWLSLIGSKGETKNRGDMFGYDTERYGGIFGLDLFGSSDCRFGLFYSYQNDKLKERISNYGNTKVNDHLLGLYHQWGDEFIYNIITLRGGYDRFETDRHIAFSSVNDNLKSKYNAYNAGIGYERGAHFQVCDALLLSPYAGVDYRFFHQDKFTESSSSNSGFALAGNKHNYQSLQTILGLTAAMRMYPGSQEFAIIGRLNWSHEFLSNYYGRQTMRFSGFNQSAGTFDIYGNTLGRDWALAGIGVEWVPVPALVTFINWDHLKNKYVGDNFWSAGARYRW